MNNNFLDSLSHPAVTFSTGWLLGFITYDIANNSPNYYNYMSCMMICSGVGLLIKPIHEHYKVVLPVYLVSIGYVGYTMCSK